MKSREELENRVKEISRELDELRSQIKEKGESDRQFDEEIDEIEENISRRGFLKKLAGGTAALGGIAMLPTASAFNIKSDNGLKYFDIGSSNPSLEVTPGGSLTVDQISSKKISGLVMVSEYPGGSLDQKVKNAKNAASPGSTLYVPPEPNGNKWNWNSDVTLDPTSLNGGKLIIDKGARISLSNYSGSDSPITIKPNIGDFNSQFEKGRMLTVQLGRWFGDGKNTDICRIQDAFGVRINGGYARNLNGFLVTLENVDAWSEYNTLYNLFAFECNGLIDFRPASVTGGSGTASFRGTEINGAWSDYCSKTSIRLRGSPYSSQINNLHVNLDGQNTDTGIILDGNFLATKAESWRFEKLKNSSTSLSGAAVKMGSNYAKDSNGHQAKKQMQVKELSFGNDIDNSNKFSRPNNKKYVYHYRLKPFDGYPAVYRNNNIYHKMN